ncbi:MAG TPA: PilZ domain-containing protein [Sphingomonas sp.]|nr:PilZ domain-containing protein [Sphingomonas sp.]
MRGQADAPDWNFGSDQRSGERFTTLFRVARVVTEGGSQHLCLIRNIGAGGLMLETYTPFGIGTAVRVEPKGCEPVSGRICWVKDKNAGVAFDTQIDVSVYLSLNQPPGMQETPRGPRIVVSRRARLRVGVMWHLVELLDLSQKGAKVRSDLPMEMDAGVELLIERLDALPGRVRWMKEDRIGIEFSSAIPLADLAEWAGTLPGEEGETAGE